jgi:hypothetical protein
MTKREEEETESTGVNHSALMISLKLSQGARGSLRFKFWKLPSDDGKVFMLQIRRHERNIYWKGRTSELIELARWILQCALIVRRGYRG